MTQGSSAEPIRLDSERLFENLFEFSPDAIVVSDHQGVIVKVNAQVGKFFGYSRDELLGKPIEILIPERFRHTHPGQRREYTSHPRVRAMGGGLELFGLRKDGSEFPVDIMLGPVQGPDGPMVLSVIRDLSDKREAEEALHRILQQKDYLEEELELSQQFDEIIGESPALKRVLRQVEDVAGTDATVLILGDTGTGKELIARAVHRLSGRRNNAFVKLNCSAIPAGLLESELFGHEKGAYTGADSSRPGLFEAAHGGTLFLDEISETKPGFQVNLLRAVQEQQIRRVGSHKYTQINVRILAASNRDLTKLMTEGRFREDLYYRLSVVVINLPGLEERREDIPLLVQHFLKRSNQKSKRNITITDSAVKMLTNASWPGNVRELENLVERLAIFCSSGEIGVADVERERQMVRSNGLPDKTPPSSLEDMERQHILRVLQEHAGNKSKAARALGIERKTLYQKARRLGIDLMVG